MSTVEDGLTTAERTKIFISGNQLRFDKSMTQGTEMFLRARAKSTVNNILASAYV
jgi:hypothetical protein